MENFTVRNMLLKMASNARTVTEVDEVREESTTGLEEREKLMKKDAQGL